MVSVGSKLLSTMTLFRLKDAIDKVLREEQCRRRKCRGCIDQIFTLRLIILEVPELSSTIELSFIDYEHAFDFVDRRALAKVLSLYGIPDKYIKVIKIISQTTLACHNIKKENDQKQGF